MLFGGMVGGGFVPRPRVGGSQKMGNLLLDAQRMPESGKTRQETAALRV